MNAKIKRNFLIHGSIHASIHDVRFHGAKYSSLLRSTFRTSAFRWCVTTAGIPTRCAVSAGSVQWRHRRRPRASPRQQQSRGCGAKGNVAIEIIEHLALKPRRIPSRSWRELIKQVWEVDPLLCPYDIHDIPVSARDAPRITHQRRADHRAHLAACWLLGA